MSYRMAKQAHLTLLYRFVQCSYRALSDVLERDKQYALIVPLLYSTYWLLHVSAIACHHQGAYYILLSYLKYKSDGWYTI
jgi:hypothetical protein